MNDVFRAILIRADLPDAQLFAAHEVARMNTIHDFLHSIFGDAPGHIIIWTADDKKSKCFENTATGRADAAEYATSRANGRGHGGQGTMTTCVSRRTKQGLGDGFSEHEGVRRQVQAALSGLLE